MTKDEEPARRMATATFCDDIRREEGNKLSLMGTYFGLFLSPQFPIVLPKFCVMIHARTPDDHPFKELKFQLRIDDIVIAEQIFDTTAQRSRPPEMIDYGEPLSSFFASVIQLAPFRIDTECILRARVETESEILKAGALMIRRTQTKLPDVA